MLRKLIILLALSLIAAACTEAPPGPDKLSLKPIAFKKIIGWDSDNHAEALATFMKSCGAFALMRDTDAVGQGEMLAPVSVWKNVCRRAKIVPSGDSALAKDFFEESFIAMKITGNGKNHSGLLTGYYEPLLNGSRTQARPYVYPIYTLPDPKDASYTRAQIDLGILKGQVPVIAYVDDPVQLFFMHIQGSGSIQLPSGEIIHVGYAGTNNQPYVAIGKVLSDAKLLDKKDITMPVLRQWLYDHPNDMWHVMWANPSYIFFQEMNGGPFGAEKVALTPGRSLAVDSSFIPLGMPVFIDTLLPETPEAPVTIQRKLMIAQDTGRAIRGLKRGDIFFGSGYAAEELAGRMKSGGDMVLLVPRALARKIKTD